MNSTPPRKVRVPQEGIIREPIQLVGGWEDFPEKVNTGASF